MSNPNFYRHMNASPFALFSNELFGKQILRREDNTVVYRFELFSERTYQWLLNDLLAGTHKKYYLANKPQFKPASWREIYEPKP